MNLDVYYRELDERMNIPDEDVGEYLARIGVRRSNGSLLGRKNFKEFQGSQMSVDKRSPELGEANDATKNLEIHAEAPELDSRASQASKPSLSTAEKQESSQDDERKSPSQAQKRKATPLLSIEAAPRKKRISSKSSRPESSSPQRSIWAPMRNGTEAVSFPSSSNAYEGTMASPSELATSSKLEDMKASSSPISPIDFADSSKMTQKKNRSPNLPHGSPHSANTGLSIISDDPSYLTTPSSQRASRRTSPRILNRKAPQDVQSLPAQKKANTTAASSSFSPAEEIEEITSFRISSPAKKVSPLRTPVKGKTKPKALLRNLPALDLKTIAPIAQRDPGPPTSPIEEVSMVEAQNPFKAAPSKLYLEIKSMIASHPSARHRDKPIPLPLKSVVRKPEDVHDDDSDSVVYVSSTSSSPRSSSPIGASTERAGKKQQAAGGAVGKGKGKAKEKDVVKDKAKGKAASSKKKEKAPPVSPEEYAQKIMDKARAKMEGKDHNAPVPNSKFLHGMNIFYTGGDMNYASERTRGRMDIIVRHGGNLLSRYDPSITTHIITDAAAPATLRALGLKDLRDIPDHIPTVKWDWIVKAMGRLSHTAKDEKVDMGHAFLDAAFADRIDVGKPERRINISAKGKVKVSHQASENNEDFSRISEFTPDKQRRASTSSARSLRSVHDFYVEEAERTNFVPGLPPSPPTSPEVSDGRKGNPAISSSNISGRPGETSSSKQQDPLAEFYAKARAEAESEWTRQGEVLESEAFLSDSETDTEILPPASSGPPKKRGWTCDTKETQRKTCVNQDIIDKLEELKALHAAKLGDEDRWRVFSYSKCIRALRNHPRRIASFAEARSIRGVGEKTAKKIMEIIETGDLRRIGYEKTDDIKTTKIFQGVYGVGQATAYQWYAAGCRSLADVSAGKGGVKLTPAQEIGIKFYDDINTRMPRAEAKEIFDLIKPIEIMGSYRRGKADCGDIDILITRPPDDGKTHEGVLSQLLAALHAADILTEDLALPEDPDDLEAIYRGLCRLPGRRGAKRRRIDFLTVPWTSRGAALLYYTGDDIFNRAIRMKANVLGYSLNQRGLFEGVVRDPRDRRVKLNRGNLIASETEEEIFRILNVPWQEPHERVRG
ncbi:hypothetical protein H0H92_013820 [Tricholoma furcatifolium]|nr:hypothetical protein H0H92_013820 [Tricholoma furcatifolium]